MSISFSSKIEFKTLTNNELCIFIDKSAGIGFKFKKNNEFYGYRYSLKNNTLNKYHRCREMKLEIKDPK